MKKRILIADDEECIRFTFSDFLTGGGYIVETSDSLSDCVKKMQKKLFDLLFLDIGFGNENGVEAIRDLKVMQPDCKIVIITGRQSAKTLVDAKRYGATDYLTKPIYEASLLYNTRKVLQ